ncbi:MAG: hypothetical protein ACK5DE_02155 [Bacteroidota bacterium]
MQTIARKTRKTILSSEIPRINPEKVMGMAKRAITKKEISLFIKLGVCENVENEVPLWVRRCAPEQRATLCYHAARYTNITSGKKFWTRLKLLLNGSKHLRIIGV